MMGRTISSWRIVVEEEITRLSRFRQFLGPEDRAVFDDLLTQCKLYAAQAGVLASPVKEVSLILSMVFAHHKVLTELERRINETLKEYSISPTSFVWVSLCGVDSPILHEQYASILEY
jgi:hypothetical protein